MKIKEIIKLIDQNEENEQAIVNLKLRHLFKWVSLGLVSAVIFGLSLVYLVKGYQTFSSLNQKRLLVSISGFLVILSAYQVWFVGKKTPTLKEAYNRYKIADMVSFFWYQLTDNFSYSLVLFFYSRG